MKDCVTFRSRWLALLLLVGLTCFSITETVSARPPRFIAKLADGTMIEGNMLADWHAPQGQPKLENQPLFSPSQPLRWLRDRWLVPGDAPEAFVELINGDCLPGTVTGFGEGSSGRYDEHPPYAIVTPAFEQRPPTGVRASELRILTRFIRRIVWQRAVEAAPSSAAFRDGRTLSYRTARLSGTSVDLLTTEGPRRVSIGDLAELHLPEVDPWEAYFDELVTLTPDAAARLIQLETTGGLVATTSLRRFEPRVDGNAADFTRWVHAVQPAWCLDVIWIPNRDVWMRRSFAATEVPLRRFRPRGVPAGASAAGSESRWRLDRNVYGQLMRPGDAEAGWGFGVRGGSRLAFPTHAAVRTLRTQFALDRVVGDGGCVRAVLASIANPQQPWFTSDFVVGSRTPIDSGAISIPTGASRPEEVLLYVDPAHSGRPPGADPLTIRDIANWVEPWFELDRAAVLAELAERLRRDVVAWKGWQVTQAETGSLKRTNFVDDLESPGLGYRTAFAAVAEPLVISTTRRLSAADRWLIVGAYRPHNGANPPKLEVVIDGETLANEEFPWMDRNRRDTRPVCVPLKQPSESNEPLAVEVRQLVGDENVPVAWRSLRFDTHHPTLRCVFDGSDPANEFMTEAELDDPSAVVREQAHNGVESLQVEPEQSLRLTMPRPVPVRAAADWGEVRFLRIALRKPSGGGALRFIVHRTAGEQPVTFLAGIAKPEDESARVIHPQPLADDWLVITRDLFADLGPCEIESITLESADEKPAAFDYLYLGRSPGDLDRIPRVNPLP